MSTKQKFRVSQHDAPVRPEAADVAPSYIRILDQHGNQRGHVHGLKSSEATVSRFGVRNARLKKINGELVWQGKAEAAPRRAAVAKLAQQKVIAKSSVTHSPTKPALARRPERGG